MKVTVIGASGFIGRHFVRALKERGDDVVVTGRSAGRLSKACPGCTAVAWEPMSGPLPPEAVEGVDAVVNLAGESVSKGRWTKIKKTRIEQSRVQGTRNVVAGIAAAENKPGVLVNASAIGYYGDGKHQVLHETRPAGKDFLAGVCQAWEAEALRVREHGVRLVRARIGVVLGKDGGAYPLMTRPFRLFGGGLVGDGKQWLGWIHIDDVVGLLLHFLDKDLEGAFNLTAPEPVSNIQFTKTVAKVLKRPSFVRVPKLALRAILGEFATIVTGSQRVVPLRTMATGYQYRFPTFQAAAENLR